MLILLAVLAVVVVGAGAFLATQGDDEGSGAQRSQEEGRSPGEGSEAEAEASDDGSDDPPEAGDPAEEQAYVDALAEGIDHRYEVEGQPGTEDGPLDYDPDESRCLAEALVATIGVGALQELATPDEIRADPELESLEQVDMSQEQAEGLYEDTAGCIDYRQRYVDILDATVSVEGLTTAQRDCVNAALTDDVIRELVVTENAGDQAGAEQVLQESVGPCENAR